MRVRLRQIILTRILWIERTEVVFMDDDQKNALKDSQDK